jgi:predicted acetyltransferase
MAGTGVKLERPDVKYQTSFIAAVHEFRANGSGLEDLRELELVNLENDFEAYIQSRFRWENPATLEPGKESQSEFWLVNDLEFLGQVALRHELHERLRLHGGHIGYEI